MTRWQRIKNSLHNLAIWVIKMECIQMCNETYVYGGLTKTQHLEKIEEIEQDYEQNKR